MYALKRHPEGATRPRDLINAYHGSCLGEAEFGEVLRRSLASLGMTEGRREGGLEAN